MGHQWQLQHVPLFQPLMSHPQLYCSCKASACRPASSIDKECSLGGQQHCITLQALFCCPFLLQVKKPRQGPTGQVRPARQPVSQP
jgi:hypothetical protein